jgi:carboxymethylenebutenolidase
VPSEMIDVPTPDGSADAYLARPADAQGPAVLLIVDAFGLRPQIERMADRIAAHGHVVLAPNVFYRDGRAPVVSLDGLEDPDRRGEVFERVMPLVRAWTPDRIVSDGGAYLDRLEQLAGGPVAITGYCMGGRAGWRIAAAQPRRVRALAGFHVGGLVTDGDDSPHRSADRLAAEVYLGFADNDRSATPEQIAAVDQALAGAGVAHRTEVYPGAAHGYTMADTPAYDEAAAERHYDELFALLDRAAGAARGAR